jgi:hypothetical protein
MSWLSQAIRSDRRKSPHRIGAALHSRSEYGVGLTTMAVKCDHAVHCRNIKQGK